MHDNESQLKLETDGVKLMNDNKKSRTPATAGLFLLSKEKAIYGLDYTLKLSLNLETQ